MSLLNSKIPIINTYDINNPSITYSRDHPVGISELLSNPDYNFDFWYCLFSCEKSFKIYDLTQLIDADSLNKIKNKLFLEMTTYYQAGAVFCHHNFTVSSTVPNFQSI